mgnify:CR=1 FL=1
MNGVNKYSQVGAEKIKEKKKNTFKFYCSYGVFDNL